MGLISIHNMFLGHSNITRLTFMKSRELATFKLQSLSPLNYIRSIFTSTFSPSYHPYATTVGVCKLTVKVPYPTHRTLKDLNLAFLLGLASELSVVSSIFKTLYSSKIDCCVFASIRSPWSSLLDKMVYSEQVPDSLTCFSKVGKPC